MKEKNKKPEIKHRHSDIDRPSVDEIDKELGRRKRNKNFRSAVFGTIYSLIIVAAIALILATTFIRVLRVYGTSMGPTLTEKDVLIGINQKTYEPGQVIAFYHNNKVLLKRVIAVAGDKVNITKDGDVYVNGVLLEEDYIDEKSLGFSDVAFPIIIGDNEYFVLGDNRTTALDSRMYEIGNVKNEDVICRVLFRVWPFDNMKSF